MRKTGVTLYESFINNLQEPKVEKLEESAKPVKPVSDKLKEAFKYAKRKTTKLTEDWNWEKEFHDQECDKCGNHENDLEIIRDDEYWLDVELTCTKCGNKKMQYIEKDNGLDSEDDADEDSFVMYNEDYDKEVKVWKQDGKWHDDEGNRYMGYLTKQDVKHYFKGNWHEVK